MRILMTFLRMCKKGDFTVLTKFEVIIRTARPLSSYAHVKKKTLLHVCKHV